MGTVSFVIRITHQLSMQKNLIEIINDEMDKDLAALPKGTRLISTQSMPITGLSSDTVVLFGHPAFENGSRMTMEYKRITFNQGESKGVGVTEVLKSVRYFDKNDKELFV